MLHRRGCGRRTDLREQALARMAVLAQHPDLDELVGRERAVELRDDRRRQTAGTDEHDRAEPVRAAFERLALGRRKLSRHASFPFCGAF